MPQDDLKIIELCLLGNSEAFSQLIDRYKGMVYNLAYRMCGNTHDSEDITQEAFIKTYQSLSRYNSAYRFSTWIYQITLNIIRDRLKKKNIESLSWENNLSDRKTIQDGLSSGDEGNPEKYLSQLDRKEKIQRAVMALPLQYREIIVLRHLHDFSYQELSSVLKISTDIVKVRLYRARLLLKKILENN